MMGSMTQEEAEIRKPFAIVVEGKDYKYFLQRASEFEREFDDVQLFDFAQLALHRWLKLFRTLPNFRSIRGIGIIRDAEEISRNTETALRNALRRNNLCVPSSPLQVVGSHPAVGYLIMPHGYGSGCLEVAVLDAAKPGMPIECVEEYLACVDRRERNDAWRAKVKVHALIAASEKPFLTLGESAAAGLWDFERPSLKVMLDFIRSILTSSPGGR